jgi:hypothetical protein
MFPTDKRTVMYNNRFSNFYERRQKCNKRRCHPLFVVVRDFHSIVPYNVCSDYVIIMWEGGGACSSDVQCCRMSGSCKAAGRMEDPRGA